MIKRSGLRTDLELLVNDAILLGKPVDAVVALAHPADGAADSVGGEASGHAAGGLVHRGEVDLDEAWSLADRILLEALHFLGMYMSTYSPASFCMVQVGFCFSLVEVNQAIKAWWMEAW